MGQNIALDKGSIAIEPFFDSTQELLSAAAPYFHIAVQTGQNIRVSGGTGANDQVSISVAGRYRFNTANLDAAAAGAAGAYDIYVTASNNNFGGPPEDLDSPTVYAFGLTVRAVGSPPPGVDQYRKVGELDWDGTNITGIRQLVGSRNDTAPIQPTAATRWVTPLKVRAAASQVSDLVQLYNSAGTVLVSMDSAGRFNTGVEVTHAAGLTLSGDGGKDTLAISSVGANTGLTIGGDANLYRVSADILKTDDEFRAAGTILARQTGSVLGEIALGPFGPAGQAAMRLGGDVNWYRGGANIVRTPNDVTIDGSLAVGGSTVVVSTTGVGGDLSGTVGNAQITPGAVGALEIANASITNAKIDPAASIAYSKLNLTNSLVSGDVVSLAASKVTAFSGAEASFDTRVRTNRLDQMVAPSVQVSFNTQRITALGDAIAATDAMNRQSGDTRYMQNDVVETITRQHIFHPTTDSYAQKIVRNADGGAGGFLIGRDTADAATVWSVSNAGKAFFNGLDAGDQRVTNVADPVAADDAAPKAWAAARANHTGTQAASTISDFNAVATSLRLDQFAPPTTPMNFGSQLLANVADASFGTHALNRQTGDARYVQSLDYDQAISGGAHAVALGDVLCNTGSLPAGTWLIWAVVEVINVANSANDYTYFQIESGVGASWTAVMKQACYMPGGAAESRSSCALVTTMTSNGFIQCRLTNPGRANGSGGFNLKTHPLYGGSILAVKTGV